jgi:hypothetical protein
MTFLKLNDFALFIKVMDLFLMLELLQLILPVSILLYSDMLLGPDRTETWRVPMEPRNSG